MARVFDVNDDKPDRNCISLPDGDCIGTGCMHDTEWFGRWGVWRDNVHHDGEGGEG